MKDYTRTHGPVALGGRLRRLSESIDEDARRIYAQFGVPFEQRWVGVLGLLVLEGPQSVGELASKLGITHVSVSQTRQSLEAAGIVAAEADATDARRRQLKLTAKGARLVRRLQPLWQAFDRAALELNSEVQNVVASLDRLDDALARQPLFDRVRDQLARAGVRPRRNRA